MPTPETPNFENQSYGLLDNTPAFVFATVSPLLSIFIEGNNTNNIGVGLLTLVVAETIAAILYIKGKPDNRPKPLAAENMSDKPITLVSFKPANATI